MTHKIVLLKKNFQFSFEMILYHLARKNKANFLFNRTRIKIQFVPYFFSINWDLKLKDSL